MTTNADAKQGTKSDTKLGRLRQMKINETIYVPRPERHRWQVRCAYLKDLGQGEFITRSQGKLLMIYRIG